MKMIITIIALSLGSFAFSVMAGEPAPADARATPQTSASQPARGVAAEKARSSTESSGGLRLPDPKARDKLGDTRLCACVVKPNQA